MAEQDTSTQIHEDVGVTLKPQHRTLVGLGIFIAMAANLMASGSLSVVLPSLVAKVGGAEFYGMVFTIGTVAAVIFGPVAGRMGDLKDKGRLMVAGTAITLLGNLATALVPNMPLILVVRFITGAGGVFVTVLGLTVIGTIFPAEQRVKWMGYYGTLTSICNAAGPIFGGMLTDTIGWEWVFFITVPLGLAGIILIMMYLPKLPVVDLGNKFDVAGVVLFGATMVAVIALCQMGGTSFPWLSIQTAGLVALVAILFALFVWVEKGRADSAMMPMNMFRYPVFTSSLICTVVLTAASIAAYMYLALYMQSIMGLSATLSGIPVTIQSIVGILLSPVLGQYIAKTGRIKSTALICCILFCLPNLYYSIMGPSAPVWMIFAAQLFYGVGATIQISIFFMAIQTGVPQDRLGVATASIQTGMAIGSSVGMAVMTAVSNAGTLEQSIPWVFRLAALLSALCIIPSLTLKGAPSKVENTN